MKAGDVFRFNGIADIHVWMIISDPSRDPHHVLIVNFTSEAPDLDPVCSIIPGDHPFIQHRTLIQYSRARLVKDEALHQKGRLEMLEPLSPTLLARIRECAMQSATLRLDYADILTDQE
jgi:hypothetical protein